MNKQITKSFPNTGNDFSALHGAENWLTENGYSYGIMDGDEAIGIAKGLNGYISKWHNLGKDSSKLDGKITSEDYRTASVEVWIRNPIE